MCDFGFDSFKDLAFTHAIDDKLNGTNENGCFFSPAILNHIIFIDCFFALSLDRYTLILCISSKGGARIPENALFRYVVEVSFRTPSGTLPGRRSAA